jgi:ABC-type phosphate transport system substrate-binding protein
MRKLTKILTGVATVAVAFALAVPAASADPINGSSKAVTPAEYDIVGVGSDSIQYVIDQLTFDYDYGTARVHNATHPYIYSWDATKPGTVTPGGNIVTKSGCKTIARPDGSSAGITALTGNSRTADGKYYCIDYARSSRGRASTDPAAKAGGVLFVPLAKDAVTYATTATTDAPANLTTANLTAIYTCSVTNWSKLGGKSATIKPFLPQTGSGTRSFFLKAIGVTTPGTCVNNSVQENEGTNALLNNAAAIVPYSVGSWLAQKYHSAACGKTPTTTQNKFGCNADGVLVLKKINGTVPFINAGTARTPNYVTNPGFSATFIRTLYDVVRYNASAANHIDPREATFFATNGFFCSNATAKTAIKAYGFMVTALCGHGS